MWSQRSLPRAQHVPVGAPCARAAGATSAGATPDLTAFPTAVRCKLLLAADIITSVISEPMSQSTACRVGPNCFCTTFRFRWRCHSRHLHACRVAEWSSYAIACTMTPADDGTMEGMLLREFYGLTNLRWDLFTRQHCGVVPLLVLLVDRWRDGTWSGAWKAKATHEYSIRTANTFRSRCTLVLFAAFLTHDH
jgi:hypothetical protein